MPARKLWYPNRYLEELVQSSAVDCTNLSPTAFPDMTTKIPLAISLNQTEFTKLFSTIMLGADLAYPDEAIEIMATFLQLVDCDDMDLCTFIANCIDSNAVTQQALFEYLLSQNITNNSGSTPLNANSGINLVGAVECDNDEMFGVAVEVTNYMNSIAKDWLQKVQDSDGLVEWLTTFVDFFPILGDLPVTDDLTDYFDKVTTEGLTSYEAAETQALLDDLACAIFLKACNTCVLTLDDIMSAIVSEAGFSLDTSGTIDLIIGIVAGTIGNEEFFYSCLLMVAGAMATGSDVGGYADLHSLETLAKLADPDTNWSVLCDDCTNEWCIELTGSDFTPRMFSGSPLAVASGGNWSWVDWQDGVRRRRSIQLVTVDTFSAELTDVEFITYSMTKGNYDLPNIDTGIGFTVETETAWTDGLNQTNLVAGTDIDQGFSGSYSVVANKMEFVLCSGSYSDDSGWSGDCLFKKIILRGTGVAPDIGTLCP